MPSKAREMSAGDSAEAAITVLELYGNAKSLIENGQPEQALELLDKAIAVHLRELERTVGQSPKDEEFAVEVLRDLYEKQADAYWAMDCYNETAASLQKAIEADHRPPSLHSTLGFVLGRLGRHEEAAKKFYDAIARNPDDAEDHHLLGGELLCLGRFEEALDHLNIALRLNPEYPEALLIKGYLLDELGKPEDALEAFNSVLRLDPECAEAHVASGWSHCRMGHANDAINSIDSAIRLSPSDPSLHFAKGQICMELSQYGQAVESFLRTMEEDTSFENVNFELGKAYNKLEQFLTAAECLSSAVEEDPGNGKAFFELGYAYFRLGKHDAAREALENAVEQQPEHIMSHTILGAVYVALGLEREALVQANVLYDLDIESSRQLHEHIKRSFLEGDETFSPDDVTKKRMKTLSISFVERKSSNAATYTDFSGMTAKGAREFLRHFKIIEKNTYVRVETPEGNWGVDCEGLFLEALLPFQANTKATKVKGEVTGIPTPFGIQAAHLGHADNFVVDVKCGSCGHAWQDGVRYQDVTVVRCPECQELSKIDTKHIHCY